jgi:hypothetical protein
VGTMVVSRETPQQCPHLKRWLPERNHLFTPDLYPWPPAAYERIEEVLAAWDQANPHGIAAKREIFRAGDWTALIHLRSPRRCPWRRPRTTVGRVVLPDDATMHEW